MKSNIKNKLTQLIIILATVVSSNSILAQQNGPQGPPPLPSDEQIEKRVTRLSTELSLSENQEKQIRDLFISHYGEVRK